jgi:cell division protease FtsH
MEYETIDADQVDDLMKRIKVRPPHQWDDNDLDGSAGGNTAEKEQADEEETKQDNSIGDPVEDV